MSEISFVYYGGKVWDTSRFQPNIYMCDEREVPFMVPKDSSGIITAEIGDRKSAALHLRWKVPSFGEVTLPTELLEPSGKPYNLHVELARKRLDLMTCFIDRWNKRSYMPPLEIRESINNIYSILGYVNDKEPEQVNARWGDLALSIALPLGERLALDCARWAIERRYKEKEFEHFKFGCNFFGYDNENDKNTQLFLDLFNYATLPFYWSGFEPEQGRCDFVKIDRLVDFLTEHGVALKGHPLLWMNTMPEWVKTDDINILKDMLGKRIHEIITHYKGKIGIWDVINEIQHVNPYDNETAIELVRFTSDTVAQYDPKALRIVNIDEPFGEYMALQPVAGMHPLEFFGELQKNNVDYDVIGLQVYHGAGWTYCRDLFEMSRYLDRYEDFGKRIHVTELGVPSAEGFDYNDYSWQDNGRIYPPDMRFRVSDAGFWHGPWNQENQADWVEGFYTILMGKPFVDAITWWDFSDSNHHFYSFAGLLDKDMNPKEAYKRLKHLHDKFLIQEL